MSLLIYKKTMREIMVSEGVVQMFSEFKKYNSQWYDVVLDIPVLIPYLYNNLTTYGGLLAAFRVR